MGLSQSLEEHGIQLSYTWVKLALQTAGLVDKQKRRGTHRRRRPRRPLPGMLLHIDASKHAWFQDDRYYDLITLLDDATSEIYYAQLVFRWSSLSTDNIPMSTLVSASASNNYRRPRGGNCASF